MDLTILFNFPKIHLVFPKIGLKIMESAERSSFQSFWYHQFLSTYITFYNEMFLLIERSIDGALNFRLNHFFLNLFSHRIRTSKNRANSTTQIH